MKLLNLTTAYFAGLLLILITIWAVIFYYQMLDEIYDSLDDGLENQKMLVMQQVTKNENLLSQLEFDEGNYTIKKVDFNQFKNFKESYRDTLMYMQNEKDYEPVRLLESVFELDGSYYKVKVITSMIEEDDLIEDLLISLLWLYLGLILSILILNNIVLRKIWNPFYILLRQLKTLNLQDQKQPEFKSSFVEEFNLLNVSLEKFIAKARESYKNQKEFIENASHEIQTPLAIAMNNLESLMETNELSREQLEMVEKTLNQMENLTKFNKSLLLLSKIQNKQFIENDKIHVNHILQTLIDNFHDLTSHKNLTIKFEEKDELYWSMNANLAQILLVNLLKNAIVYSPVNSEVKVIVDSSSVVFANDGEQALDENLIYQRFFKSGSSSSSNGLGLAIVKSIVDLYPLQLQYSFNQKHIFTVSLQ